MEPTADSLTDATLGAISAQPSADTGWLQLSVIPMRTQPAFPLTHTYFEVVYAPILGPSAVLIARHLARTLMSADGGVTVCPAVLARELGLRAGNDDPLGRRSRLRRGIDRLEHHHLARWFDDQHLGLVSAAPAISTRTRDTLPPAARCAHDRFVEVIDLRDGATGECPAPAEPGGEKRTSTTLRSGRLK